MTTSDPKAEHECIADVLETLVEMDCVALQEYNTEGEMNQWTRLDVSMAINPDMED